MGSWGHEADVQTCARRAQRRQATEWMLKLARANWAGSWAGHLPGFLGLWGRGPQGAVSMGLKKPKAAGLLGKSAESGDCVQVPALLQSHYVTLGQSLPLSTFFSSQ